MAWSTPIAMVSLQHTKADGWSESSMAWAARRPNSMVSSPRALSRVVDRPRSCMRSTQPLRRSSPMYDDFCQPTQAIRS